MADETLTLSGSFEPASEADWRAAVEKALKGKPPETLDTVGIGGLVVQALYRETEFPSAQDTMGHPGVAPFVRGPGAARDAHLPWDIRQAFTHPDPTITNAEILRDLERGVSSIELRIDSRGETGIALCELEDFKRVLDGVRADIATVALDSAGGTGTSAAALLALWGETADDPTNLKLDFNIDPLGSLARLGLVEGGLDTAFKRLAGLHGALALRFPLARIIRVDARMVREAGGSPMQELAACIGSGIDTLRRLDAAGLSPEAVVPRMSFVMSAGANYGLEIAKLRAARRLWARCLQALGLEPQPMLIQSTTLGAMLTRYDPWVNMLRCAAAGFAGAVGGADIVSVTPFNAPLGVPDELGRRVARNAQIIAMEESHLGKVVDPAAGAWFTETVAEDMAEEAWKQFQTMEREGGYGASLLADKFQSRVAENRTQHRNDVARRKIPITGVSEFPLLEEISAPAAKIDWPTPKNAISDAGLKAMLPTHVQAGKDDEAEPFWPIRHAEPFERLRDHAEARLEATGARPAIFLATLGPLAEHTARVDFARNLFAAGGIEAKSAPKPPDSISELVAAWTASGCALAVLCGSDARYDTEAATAAATLKEAGVQRLYIAGKFKADGIDSNIHVGVDVVATLELAHAELGIV
ncbi:MAG: methylmalonyl-CoA mutase family protein [Pseudomonadota bacterium]